MEMTRKEYRKMKRHTFNKYFALKALDLFLKGFMSVTMAVGCILAVLAFFIGMMHISNVFSIFMGW